MASQEYLTITKLSLREMRRFFSLVVVNQESGCWIWQGELNHADYGKFFLRGKKQKAHRIMYAWAVGPIPYGGPGEQELDHYVCENHRCCNPAHLRLVTHGENMNRTRQTYCKNGHPLSEARILDRSNKGRWEERVCRQCERMRCAAYRKRKRAARLDY